MRNAPLLASAYHHPKMETYSFLDERALAYRALGNGKYEGNIPALTCTSGTAMANFLPAVIEAYRSHIPMIILTADRPVELVKIDANQTINQADIFKEFTCHTINLEAPSTAIKPQRLRSLIANAVGRAKIDKRPVHINIPLRDPLTNELRSVDKDFLEQAMDSFNSHYPKNESIQFDDYRENSKIKELINNSKSPLLVIGKLERINDKTEYIKNLKSIDIPKFIDVTSGIKYQFSLEDKLSPTFDHPEVFDSYQANKPDLIIHLGGRLVSKHYYRFQEENPNIQVLHITNSDTNHDPGFSNNLKVICDPLSFLSSLKEYELHLNPPQNFFEFTEKKREIIEGNELSFPFISKNIIERTNEILNSKYNNHNQFVDLLIGNSTAIRSFDSYIHPSENYHINTYSNRGVSGIEGFVATLIGMTDYRDNPKVLVLGDISFKHDLNSLYMLRDVQDKNLTLVIINNYSGGIFELLPIAKEKDFLPLLSTPHEDNFEMLVRSFEHISYDQVTTKEDFLKKYESSLTNEGINFIEVIIDSNSNKAVYDLLRTVRL